MKWFMQMAGLGVVFSGLVAAVLSAAPITRAQSVDEAWKRGVEAGDVEAVVACYGEHATLWLPGAPEARGRAAIREVYRGLLAANTVSGVTYSETAYRVAGDLQAGSGQFSMTLTPKQGGAPTRLSGRFSTLVEKERGRWVYTVDHASTGPTP